MDQEVDDYIKESIGNWLGLPISVQNLETKLRVSEDRQKRLRDQCVLLISKLKEKDQAIERARAESSMNAQALKKFVEENQKLAAECTNLLNQRKKLESECLLYHQDREALMDFGNEADERAKEAEARVNELEEGLRIMSEELQVYKCQSGVGAVEEKENLICSILDATIRKDESASGRKFLEANSQDKSCQKLLKMWSSLRPTDQKFLSLVDAMKRLEEDNERLLLNLNAAEEEVALVTEHNRELDRMLRRKQQKERSPHSSTGKHGGGSASARPNKRKSSPKLSSPIEKKADLSNSDFANSDFARQPLSPLWHNSPESKMNKK